MLWALLVLSHSCSRSRVLQHAAAALGANVLSPVANSIPPFALEQAQQQVPPSVLYTPPSVKGTSTPEQLALAEHLSKMNARFYGAYWCSFCLQQRAIFGAGGARALPYIECARDGYKRQECPPQVTGYPTWEIGGEYFGGFRSLSQLQSLSGFDPSVKFAEYLPPAPPPRKPPPPGGYKPPTIESKSDDKQLALASHLRDTGAKFYGAYWCKFCERQRDMFGAVGAERLPYVECALDGYQSAASVCNAKEGVTGYPTWEIGGKMYGGMQSFETLAKLSNFDLRPYLAGASLNIDFSADAPVSKMGDDCVLADGPDDCK